MLRHLDLFSGIGGFALAARMVGGYETVAFCEIEPYCQAVLRKHWPGVPIYEDVRTLPYVACDVLTAGFPCQDISIAGKHIGIDGERSGLWHAIPPIICKLRPRGVLLENVSALLGRGLSRVLGDLAEVGYDAEWHCIRASRAGLPHSRDRAWIVAYPENERRRYAEHGADESHLTRRLRASLSVARSNALSARRFRDEVRAAEFVRTLNGIPGRAHRIVALGNAIVPQVAAIFLQAIKECEEASHGA